MQSLFVFTFSQSFESVTPFGEHLELVRGLSIRYWLSCDACALSFCKRRYITFTSDNVEKLKKAQSVLKDIKDYAKRAPILICAITKKTYSDNSNYNRLHFHDLGAANENMFLEAFNQGLIMHEMGGFDVQKAREVFNIPEDFEVGIMIAIVYQDTHHILPERLIHKAFTSRQRKPLSEIAFVEELGNGISANIKDDNQTQ